MSLLAMANLLSRLRRKVTGRGTEDARHLYRDKLQNESRGKVGVGADFLNFLPSTLQAAEPALIADLVRNDALKLKTILLCNKPIGPY